jgi:ATP-binding cassette subfamily F protein 3
VSHDRYFLDQTVDRVWELTPADLYEYRGNYSEFRQQRSHRIERHGKDYQAQQEHISKEQDFIQRNIAGQNTKQAQGRRTRLARFMEEEALEPLAAERPVAIQFDTEAEAGQTVLETHQLVVGRQEALFAVPDLKLWRGECAALIGPNGAGKSTFIKTLIGQLPPLRGEISWGVNVSIGYFAQAHEDLNPQHTVLDSMLAADPSLKISEARQVLGRYLFSGDEVHKQVGDLSGGERGRLALARLAQQGANLLLLDEPTNHLDLQSQEVLQRALASFPGTILLASHDRYLIQALASQVWFVHPDHAEMRRIQGSYEDYLIWRRQWEQEQQSEKPRPSPAAPKKSGGSRKAVTRRLEQTEADIAELERKMASLAAKIEQEGQDHEKLRSLGDRYQALEVDLKRQLLKWEQLSEELEGP